MIPRVKILIVLFIFIIFVSGCATVYNPATGKNEWIFISDEQEVEIGKGVVDEVMKEYPLLNDSGKQALVQRVGSRIAAVCDRQNMPYKFSVIDDKTLNAFAVPGGFVYIHSGLLDKLNENELAFVLGHEVGHVSARHSVKRLQANLGFQMLLTLAFIGAGGGDSSAAQSVAGVSNTIYNLVAMGYSREDEFLADRLGIKYANLSGYKPDGAVGALGKLKTETKGWDLPFSSSHPPLDERIKQVRTEISKLNQ